ncbi:MAG: DHHA1 domain-containing protein, partial [Candidatus Omnitrophica bacterium]|nr:DHHA1 domain-containing protein [Candidatus Omnitrophota bacterium]
LTPDLSEENLDADKLIKEISGFIEGSGGGRKDFAQAGGKNPKNIELCFTRLKEILLKHYENYKVSE